MKKMVFGLVALLLTFGLTACGESTDSVKEKTAMNIRFEFISRDFIDTTTVITTVRDKETGIYYAALSSSTTSNGIGGMSPLYDKDGMPFGHDN
ncbi:uncharacterized lipoprotein YehR (DUF1307 family) [Paenibacillus sp. RC254]